MHPYYAPSQFSPIYKQRFLANQIKCSSLEYWRWFDDRCTPQERAYMNAARNGDETISRMREVIAKQGGWKNV